MILGSKALAWLYLSWPIQAEMFPKQHLKAPPPCTDKSYFGPSTAPVHRFTDLASAGSEFLQPPNSTRARAVQPPPPPHPTPLHSFQDGGSKDTAKAPSTGCETPESPHPNQIPERYRDRPSKPLKITSAVLKLGFPSGSCLSEGL